MKKSHISRISVTIGMTTVGVILYFLIVIATIWKKPSEILDDPINFTIIIFTSFWLIILYVWGMLEHYRKKKGYVREKVYITRCPYCGYEFKYGVSKYCPNCHHRIWRPYRWIWVKKEKDEKEKENKKEG